MLPTAAVAKHGRSEYPHISPTVAAAAAGGGTLTLMAALAKINQLQKELRTQAQKITEQENDVIDVYTVIKYDLDEYRYAIIHTLNEEFHEGRQFRFGELAASIEKVRYPYGLGVLLGHLNATVSELVAKNDHRIEDRDNSWRTRVTDQPTGRPQNPRYGSEASYPWPSFMTQFHSEHRRDHKDEVVRDKAIARVHAGRAHKLAGKPGASSHESPEPGADKNHGASDPSKPKGIGDSDGNSRADTTFESPDKSSEGHSSEWSPIGLSEDVGTRPIKLDDSAGSLSPSLSPVRSISQARSIFPPSDADSPGHTMMHFF